jgi:hypothetical protein
MKFKTNQFLKVQGKELVESIIKNHDFFFHCTDESNRVGIEKEGLDVKYSKKDNKIEGEPDVLRFCTEKELMSVLRMKKGKYPEAVFIVFRIPSEVIVGREFGVDWSAVQTRIAAPVGINSESEMSNNQATELIQRSGFISCYESIPPECITEHECPYYSML